MAVRGLFGRACVLALIGMPAGTAQASGGGGGGGGGGVPSVSAPRYNVVEEYQSGVTALQSGDYRKADKNLGHVLEVAPKEPHALFAMGLAKAGEKDFKGASRFYDRALKADPQQIGARRELAITEVQLGQPDRAKLDLAALQSHAALCGDTCPQASDLKAAITAVEAAMNPPAAASPAPGPSAALERPNLLFATSETGDRDYVQAVRLINEHRYVEALSQLTAAQSAFGPHPDILTYIGYVNRKLGRLDEAEHYYLQALDIYPNHVGATEYYGELKVVRGDIAGAKQMLTKLEQTCTFGCVEEDDLRRWIDLGHDPF